MSIELLDCTLRDGTYINDGEFGQLAIKNIVTALNTANIDIVECGWLFDKKFNPNMTFFEKVNDFEMFFPDEKRSYFSLMLYCNKYDLKKIPNNTGKIDIIREIFHKDEFRQAVLRSDIIKEKGYKLFYQVVNTGEYSNRELMELSGLANKIMPDCLYIVDTHGGMFPNDLKRVLEILSENLDDAIKIGFHSHNNLQLSFALSIQFIDFANTHKKDIILDSSLFGMGRGAGNLNTELIAEYLDRFYFKNYNLYLINKIITDEILKFKKKEDWGYSIPYLISGNCGIHSRYAKYLTEKYNVRPEVLRDVFSFLDENGKKSFSKDSAENAYAKCIG